MKRAFLILLAAASVASAQTYLTVTADTNRVIRTNFSLVRSQVSDLSGASFAISNITGLQTALAAKMTTNGSAAGLTNFPALLLATNGDAVGLTNFPASLLRTNGSAGALTNFPATLLQTNSALTNFPAGLLRTNGDGSALTNLPNANLSNAIGVLPVSNGGSGATNAGGARTNFSLVWSGLTNADAAGFRTALSLGTAATNESAAFQPASSALTNLAANNASSLTNFPAELLRTNGNGGGLTNVQVDLNAVLPSYSNNVGKVLSVATGATNVEWTAISNTVTDGSLITNFPSYLLQTNGSAGALTNFPAELLRTNGNADALTNFPTSLMRTNGDASLLTNFPTFNQNTTGTANNVTGTVQISNGGTGAGNAANARINLLPSYSGNALRVLALNSNATDLVWSVDGGGAVDLSSTNVTGTLAVNRGGTGATNGATAMTNLGIYFTEGGGFSAVTLGESATMTSGSESAVVIGQGANVNNNDNGIAIGKSAKATGSTIGEGIAIGVTAVVSNAQNSIQLGTGVNSTATTIQVQGWGTVNSTEWGYLANSSTRGGYAMTNTAGISGSKTFVAYDGATYTTNTVTFSNGIITGWTP